MVILVLLLKRFTLGLRLGRAAISRGCIPSRINISVRGMRRIAFVREIARGTDLGNGNGSARPARCAAPIKLKIVSGHNLRVSRYEGAYLGPRRNNFTTTFTRQFRRRVLINRFENVLKSFTIFVEGLSD